MTPKEFKKGLKVLAGAGVTMEEASAGMNKAGGAIRKIMEEEIKAVAKGMGVSFKEAERIYLGRLDAVSGKKGKIRQWWALRKIKKFGGFDY